MKNESYQDSILISSQNSMLLIKNLKKILKKFIHTESIESKINPTTCVEVSARYLELVIAFIQNITNVKCFLDGNRLLWWMVIMKYL